jgi:hypothetical protein
MIIYNFLIKQLVKVFKKNQWCHIVKNGGSTKYANNPCIVSILNMHHQMVLNCFKWY